MKLQFFIRLFIILIAVIIISDCAVPGETYKEEITEIVKEFQRNYKSTGGHYTYHVLTPQNYFIVDKELAVSVEIGQPIEYRLSYLFNELNGYRLYESDEFERHSMRWFFGLIFPALIAVILAFSLKRIEKNETFIFVMQVLLVADLIYMLN